MLRSSSWPIPSVATAATTTALPKFACSQGPGVGNFDLWFLLPNIQVKHHE
jgi:hypothetical protein